MIITVTGTDHKKRNQYLEDLLTDLETKRPGATVTMVEAHEATVDTVAELLGTPGLYDMKRIVILKNLTDKDYENAVGYKIWRGFFEKAVTELNESDHAFVLISDEVPAAVKKLQAVATKNKDFSLLKQKKARDAAVFSFVEAYIGRNKKVAWQQLYELQIIKQAPIEEIVGVLIWQLRALSEILQTTNKDQTTLAPFVYNKTKKAAHNWSVKSIDRELVRWVTLSSGDDRGDLGYQLEQATLAL